MVWVLHFPLPSSRPTFLTGSNVKPGQYGSVFITMHKCVIKPTVAAEIKYEPFVAEMAN